MSGLQLSGVSVRRGGASVLNGASLDVAPGEVVALLGSNGVGKSTTLRTISGLHRPYAGTITFDGTTISGMRPNRIVKRGIAHVPEARQVFAGLTVRENLEMGASSRGRLGADDLREVVELFPMLGEMLSRRAGVLSGGQQQMLAIARGLMSRPSLMLMDEPSLGLAPKIVTLIGDVIRQLRDRGIGVLLVEQNATMALDVATRGYLMAHGRISLAGEAADLRQADSVRAVYLGGRRPTAGN
jgi:branched-chain amino acid transport system ATP-binding protein